MIPVGSSGVEARTEQDHAIGAASKAGGHLLPNFYPAGRCGSSCIVTTMNKSVTLAATKAASRKPAARSTSRKLNAADFEAPITITLSGPLAAIVRFGAFLDATTPEEAARRAIAERSACELANGFGFDDDHAEKWLGAK